MSNETGYGFLIANPHQNTIYDFSLIGGPDDGYVDVVPFHQKVDQLRKIVRGPLTHLSAGGRMHAHHRLAKQTLSLARYGEVVVGICRQEAATRRHRSIRHCVYEID